MKKQLRQTVRRLLAAMVVCGLLLQTQMTAYAYPGTISQDNVNVRADATTTSEKLGSFRQGAEIDIEGEVTDASGQVWYQITYEGKTGYIRGDLVDAEDGGNADPNSEDPGTDTPASGSRTGTVTTQNAANVRTGAGTAFPPQTAISPLQPGSVVEIIGEEQIANGELWYQIRYNDNEGWMRSDYLTVSDSGEPAEPTTPEQPVETPVTVDPGADNPVGMMGQQYTVAYEMDDTGETVPYLVDNNNNSQRWKVETLINSYEDTARLNNVESTNTVLKVVCVVLGIITLVAVILLLLLGLRFRRYTGDDYEDDYDRGGAYDDEDGDYDDEDEEDDRRGGKSGGLFSRFKRDREDDYDDEDGDYDDEDDEEEPRAIRRVYQPERASYDEGGRSSRASRRPRNFMEDDDEDDFEYGFLDDER